jgi:hypothetical protein
MSSRVPTRVGRIDELIPDADQRRDDPMPSTWTRVRARVNRILPEPLYTAYRIGPDERVGRVSGSVDAARSLLRDSGYEPQHLSAAKARPSATTPFDDDDLHALSYRRIPTEHPDEWAREDWRPDQCQYHVHAFERADGTDLFSHYELRPHLLPLRDESVTTALRRLRTHYRPEYGRDYLRGVTDLDV